MKSTLLDVRSKLGIQLLFLFSGILILSTCSLAFLSIRIVSDFGEISAKQNEANIRVLANGFMARIAHEQAMRYESVFDRYARSSAIIATQAAYFLDNTSYYKWEGRPQDPDEQLRAYPFNGIFSTTKDADVMGLYWGAPEIDDTVMTRVRAISHIDRLLAAVKAELPRARATYVTTVEGIARYYPNIHGVEKLPAVEEFDIRNASWYSIAKPEQNPGGATVWTNIYEDSVGQGLMITASTPVYGENGDFFGVAGIDITLDTMVTDLLERVPACDQVESMFIFLMDEEGKLIAFPDESLDAFGLEIDREELVNASMVLRHSMLESTNPEISRIGRAIIDVPHQVSSFDLNGRAHIISSHQMPSTNWRLAITVPESNLLSSIESSRQNLDATVDLMRWRFVLVTILFLGLSIIGCYSYLVRNLIRPLKKLTEGIEKVEDGDLTTRVEAEGTNEIGHFAKAFNTMVGSLHEAKEREADYTKGLEQRVGERTEALSWKNRELKLALTTLEQEIAERHKVESELRKRDQTLGNIVENSTNLFYSHTPSHEITYISPQSHEFLQCSPEEAKVRWTEFATGNPHNAKALELTERAIATGERQPPYELELRGKKGRVILVEVREVPVVKDGKTVSIVGSLTDITEQKKAEQALIESERRYRWIFDFSPVSVWVHDLSGVKRELDELCAAGITNLQSYLDRQVEYAISLARKVKIIDINSATIELLEARTKDEVFDDLARIFPTENSLPLFSDSIARLQEGGENVQSRFSIRTLKGNKRVVKVSSVIVPGFESDWSRVLVSMFDVTEMLEAQRAAEKANETKSIFLANMSHDLRTPINGVMGVLQVLQSGILGSGQKQYIDMGIESCRRLVGLLSDILDVTKIEAGMLSLSSRQFSIAEMFAELDNMFAQQVADGQKLLLSADSGIPRILHGDDHRLLQILMNLVGNGCKFSSGGDVEVSVSPAWMDEQRIFLLFTVSDSGIGIPDEKISDLFEVFVQADATSARQGSGLGLAIVRNLTLLMGGSICMDSEVGKGTSVYLNVPFAYSGQDELVRLPKPDGAAKNFSAPFRSLVVEDDDISRVVLSSMLESAGGEVDQAADGKSGLDMIKANEYDVVFMDVQLPDLDGLELTRIIRNSDEFKDRVALPVIAMTATAMAGDREKCLEAGMSDYISKPVESSVLHNKLGKYVGTRSGTD